MSKMFIEGAATIHRQHILTALVRSAVDKEISLAAIEDRSKNCDIHFFNPTADKMYG